LAHLHELARRTDCLRRFIIFGSYVTAKTNPNDVDVILIMDDAFRLETCPMESRALYDHAVAQARYSASVFWIRPALLIGETVEQFIVYWQIKRGGGQRGIVDLMI
jgi:predicted nucleotidyltransferase